MFLFAPICSVQADVSDWKMILRPVSYECHDTSRNLTCYVERPQQRYAPDTMMPIPTTAPVNRNEYRLQPPDCPDGTHKYKWGYCINTYRMTWIRTYLN